MSETDKRDEYLRKLAALCREYMLAPGACGCCDGVWVAEVGDSPVLVERYFDLGKELEALDENWVAELDNPDSKT